MSTGSWKQIHSRVSVDNATKTAVLLTGETGKVIRITSVHIFPTTNSSGGTGVITLRDGTGGAILMSIDASNHAGVPYDLDFHDDIGYPLTAGNSLSLEVSGATTDASVVGIALGYIS